MEREFTPGQVSAADVYADAPSGEAGKYVHCVVKTADPREFWRIGIGEAGIHTVHYQRRPWSATRRFASTTRPARTCWPTSGSSFGIELPVRTEPVSIGGRVRRAVVDSGHAVMKP